MGKKIDRFVLTSILAVGLFLYFEAAFQNRILAILLALLSCTVILKTLGQLTALIGRTGWHQKRMLHKNSGGMLMQMAGMDENEARTLIQELVSESYADAAPIALALLHPSISLGQAGIFKAWREFRGTDRLILCTTGKCSSDARIFASSLKGPKLAIVDGPILSQLIAEHPEIHFPTHTENKKKLLRFKYIAQLIFNRRNAPRGLLFSFSMLVMYVFSGNIGYLCGSLFLLFTALVSFRRVNRPAKLF